MLAMLERVARAATAAGAGPVSLASSEPHASELAQKLGIGHVTDGGLPWNEGLVHALGLLRPQPDAVMYLAGDLPAVSADEVRALAAAVPARGIAIARAHDGGTNGLVVRPADALAPSFGVAASASVHAGRAAAVGLDVRVIDLPGLKNDVDTPEDAVKHPDLVRLFHSGSRA
jgi:2-phospho-L-lactate guanylyltransferase